MIGGLRVTVLLFIFNAFAFTHILFLNLECISYQIVCVRFATCVLGGRGLSGTQVMMVV
jgi:hypothetical protein